MPGRVSNDTMSTPIVDNSTHSIAINGTNRQSIAEDDSVKSLDRSLSMKLENDATNGLVPNGAVQKISHGMNGEPTSSYGVLPPEIQHITDGFISMGTLIQRVTQVAFNELSETLERMAEPIDMMPENGLTNGTRPGQYTRDEQTSLKKRIALLNWSKIQRDRFIKLAVISQWTKNLEQVERYIDLMFWSNEKFQSLDNIADALGRLRLDLQPFKLPSPDITTALEVLSTGKASWMPDLGFIPLPPLTPQKMLRTLKDMNAELHIRLTLYEDLPYYLRNWECHNGRATFTFPNEFEFDVTISEEDPSVQLWFVDLRFLYTPTIVLDEGILRTTLQIAADNALAEGGVPACAEFLRNYVLTHQITTLRNQLVPLIRGFWKGAIRFEQVHRSLIIQYWLSSPFPKSWIEIGIGSGKSGAFGKSGKSLLPGQVEIPRIGHRWKRYGQLAPDTDLDLQLQHISAESLLRRAIARHTTLLLTATKNALERLGGSTSRLSIMLHSSPEEPVNCKLDLQLGTASKTITFAVEQFSGRLCLHPATPQSAKAEFELNKGYADRDPLHETANLLEIYLCLDVIWVIERQAAFAGWKLFTYTKLQTNQLQQVLEVKVVKWTLLKPKSWTEWVIGVTASLEGSQWWALQIVHENDQPIIKSVQALPLATENANNGLLLANFFKEVLHEATQFISDALVERDLRTMVETYPTNLYGDIVGNEPII